MSENSGGLAYSSFCTRQCQTRIALILLEFGFIKESRLNKWTVNAAEEEIASRSEAIYDGAERVLNFSILYTHPHTHTYSPT
jgi:hypothetical protein